MTDAIAGLREQALHTLDFATIPSGWCCVGFGLDDVYQLLLALPAGDRNDPDALEELVRPIADARPLKWVAVASFLSATRIVPHTLAAQCLPEGWAHAKLGAHYHVAPPYASFDRLDDAQKCAESCGMRLLTESEWEYIAREGGAVRFAGVPAANHPFSPRDKGAIKLERPNAWGVGDLQGTGEWTSSMWGEDGVTRGGHTMFQDAMEVVWLHAASRVSGSADGAVLRLAYDADQAQDPGPGPTGFGATWTHTLEAMLGSAKTRKVAIRAFALISGAQAGPDTWEFVLALIDALPKDPKLAAELLSVVATGLVGAPETCMTEVAERLIPVLHHPVVGVRINGARVLALTGHKAAATACAAAFAIEKKDKARASLALALGLLNPPGAQALLRARLAKEKGAWSKPALAIALVTCGEPVGPLADTLALALSLSATKQSKFAWYEGNLAVPARRALESAPPERVSAAVDSLIDLAIQRDVYSKKGRILWITALNMLLGERTPIEGSPGPLVRKIIQALTMPGGPEQDLPMLAYWGLPTRISARRRWLGITPPSAAERDYVIDGVVAHGITHLRQNPNAFDKLYRVMGAEEVLDIRYRDLNHDYSPHHIHRRASLRGVLLHTQAESPDAALAWIESELPLAIGSERLWLLHAWALISTQPLPKRWDAWVVLDQVNHGQIFVEVVSAVRLEGRETIAVKALTQFCTDRGIKSPATVGNELRDLALVVPTLPMLRALLCIFIRAANPHSYLKQVKAHAERIEGSEALFEAFDSAYKLTRTQGSEAARAQFEASTAAL